MRLLIQRVQRAEVRVDGSVVGQIGRGYCVFVGIAATDTQTTAEKALQKLTELRLMPDPAESTKPFNVPLAPAEGLLLVSQFTLYGDLAKGRRPSFLTASPPDHSAPLFAFMVAQAKQLPHPVASGTFGAMMQVELVNDGPATFWLEIE